MAGIGEASAVIGVVQVGFSLARTLSTYIGDYKDSRDSIIGLAVQLETTIIHVRELNTLVRSSEAAGSVSEDSRKVAENAVTNSKRLIEKLVKLLTKADLPDDPDAIVNIKPGDIDVRTLTKFYWPLVKPQVDVVNLELQSMKTEILLARSCIQAQTGSTPAERAAGEENIVALTKSKLLARRLLKQAKAEEKRAAMSAQRPDYVPRPPSGRNRPSERYSSGPYRGGTYDSISDDGRETDLMARDLRESILQDLQRKDAERKAKEKDEEAARKLAIENYQQTVKEKLTRLQQATDTTQRRMKEIFGPHLDEKLVQKFLDEQQSGQMQDEFGELLSKIGVVPPVAPMDLIGHSGVGSTGKDGVRKPKRRWFFKRRPSQSSESTGMSNNSTHMMTSGLQSSERTKFLHIVMTYDLMEGYEIQTLDSPALRHRPCGLTCNFDNTLRAWQALPRSAKKTVSRWVDEYFGDQDWHLHAALPIQKDVRTTRKFLQKAVLGTVAYEGMATTVLVFSSTGKYVAPETGSTTGDSVSNSSHTYAPISDSGASRVELSQTDMEQMREWLTTRGLSTAKIAELEALVVKQKESAAAVAATQPSMSYDQTSPQDDNTVHSQTNATVPAEISRQGSGSHVRFVTGDVAPSTRRKSAATIATSRGSNTYNRGYAEPDFRPSELYRTSGTRDGLRQDHGDDSPPPPTSSYEGGRSLPYPHGVGATRFLSDDEWYDTPRRRNSRRVDDKDYRMDSLQSAYDRRDPRENRTRTEDEWGYQDRRQPIDRQHSHEHHTSLDPSYYGNRDQRYTRTTEYYYPPYVDDIYNIYNKVYEDPGRNPFSPPSSSRPVLSSSRDHRRRWEDEPAKISLERRRHSRDRGRDRGGSDSSSGSRGRHRSSERHVVRHNHMEPTDSRRYPDDDNARLEAEEKLIMKKKVLRSPGLQGREPSPRPFRIIAPSTRQEKREILTKSYRPYNEYSPHERNYPGLTQTPRFVYPDILPIPRQLSPEPLLDDASDAEDAALEDAELKKKMLVKYTGSTVANTPAGPDRTGDKPQGRDAEQSVTVAKESAAGPGAENDFKDIQGDSAAVVEERRNRRTGATLDPEPGLSVDEPASPDSQTVGRPASTSPIPAVQRHNTVTVEDYDSDAETGTHRSRRRSSPHRPTSSPSSASSAQRSLPVIDPQTPEPRSTNDPPDRNNVEEVD